MGAAMLVAERAPQSAQAMLRGLAQNAFMDGFQTAILVSGGATGVAAVLAFAFMPHRATLVTGDTQVTVASRKGKEVEVPDQLCGNMVRNRRDAPVHTVTPVRLISIIDQRKIGLGGTAIGASPALQNILPPRSRCDAGLGMARSLVIDMVAEEAGPTPHLPLPFSVERLGRRLAVLVGARSRQGVQGKIPHGKLVPAPARAAAPVERADPGRQPPDEL